MKLLSIITVVYEDFYGLKKTIESFQSLLTLKENDFEIIIVDGSSNKKIKKFIEEFKGLPLFLYSEPDQGIYDAMNKGIKNSRGEYLWFINAGDELNEHFDDTFLNNCKKDLDLIFMGFKKNYKNKIISKKIPNKRPLNLGMPTSHQSIIYNRKFFSNGKKYNKNFKICGDYDHFINIASQSKKILFLENYAVTFDCDGISSKKPFLLLYESLSITFKSNLSLLKKIFIAFRTLLAVFFFQLKRIYLNVI